MKKTAKLLVGINVAAASILVGGCGVQQPERENIVPEEREEISNKDMPPEVEGCEKLTYDEDEDVWVCDDEKSPQYRNYYYGGSFFPTLALLYASSAYRSGIGAGKVRPRNPQGPITVNPGASKPNTNVKPGTQKPSSTNSSGFGTGSKTGGSYGG